MAYITPVSGGAQPVFATDVLNPVAAGASTAATPVNFAGPKLDFYRVVANTSVATQQDVNEYVSNVIQSLQRVCTVAQYQVDGTVLSFGTYPAGAFGNALASNATSQIDTAIFLSYANITYTGYQLDSCTSIGFKLAAS
jgi:hypothetical protein